MRRAVPAVGALLLLAGCGGPADDGAAQTGAPSGATSTAPTTTAPTTTTAAPPTATPSGGTELTVVLDADGTGSTTTYTLTCDPPAGDVPDPPSACAGVTAVGAAGFAPADPDQVCTEQFGGPATATVRGTVGGAPVDAAFDRTDGCAISRWDALSALFPTGR